MAELRPHADRVTKISIIPRGIAALGYTQQTPAEDRYLLKRSELLDRLDVLLGGRIAEELVFGDVSTGAQDDLQRASDMARRMITQFGMDEALGPPPTKARPIHSSSSGLPQRERKEYSERTAQMIDAQVRKTLAEAGLRVRATLAGQRARLDALARLLLEREVVDRNDLDRLLSGRCCRCRPRGRRRTVHPGAPRQGRIRTCSNPEAAPRRLRYTTPSRFSASSSAAPSPSAP